ncbi:ATP-binding protein [Mitsuaria sp. BK037]|uniref:hybrid sensor histidine kinase/response regulator n=1 Tax=Mitsuaria sp. BK037 TaxID=2587122 RepID=UPI00160CE90F|nr:ATP-binding protein [Mitsuaria sp. BK037]MBB3281904.1 two-component system CheB/CheR fusion protein [Mitsuaria sp. BK037]
MVIERHWLRWPAAALVFVAATWLNLQLQPYLNGRGPLLPYFPSLVLVGLACGLGPALAFLAASALAVLYFWIDPVGQIFPVNSLPDATLVVLYLAAGALIASVSAWAGRLMQKERNSRRRLNLALAAGRMVTWDWDVVTGFANTAGGAKQLFGRHWSTMEDMLADMSAEDAGRFRERYRYATESGGRFSLACPITRPDNAEVVWTQFDGYVSLDAKGRAAHAYGVAVDVTAQQEALRASQAAEERFHLALHSGKVMAWECDLQGRYTWAFNTPMGFSREALIGAEVGSLVGEPQFAEIVREAVATARPMNLAQQVSHGGRTYQLLTSLRPVQAHDGQVQRVIGATVDVSELSAAQEELRRESQRKDAFLATLAHELRNPMAPIRYAVAMLRQSGTEATRAHATDIIARQSAHMARLLDDLLDMSRITRNVVELKRQLIDLRTVVRQALEAVEPLYSEMKHRVSLSLPPRPVLVDGDPTRLQQVLGNLLDNAAKYSPEPGEVTVHVSAEADRARITVTDRGIGIAMEMQPRVFELFTRIDARGAAPSGLGIGLAVSKQLVQLHDGSIAVESEGVGHGSRFIVELPLAPGGTVRAEDPAAPTAVAETAVGAETAAAEAPCVMVVDDNVDGANTLAEVLRGAHYRASVAYSGEDALRHFERLRPRVMLLDIGLPGISGTEVARRLRAMAPRDELALIAITGWGQRSDREATAAAGFDAHLVKPVEFNELERVMQQLLGAPRAVS